MSDLVIRNAEPRDVPEIKRIGERAWNAVYAGVLEQDTIDAALSEWYSNDAILENVQHSDLAYFVGVRDDRVVGYVVAGRNELDAGEIAAIYVDPDHWREGIGTRLLEYVEDYGRSDDWDTIQIRVIAGNDPARSFYEGHGYTVADSVEVPLFGEPIEEVCYEKRLV